MIITKNCCFKSSIYNICIIGIWITAVGNNNNRISRHICKTNFHSCSCISILHWSRIENLLVCIVCIGYSAGSKTIGITSGSGSTSKTLKTSWSLRTNRSTASSLIIHFIKTEKKKINKGK